MDSHPRGGGGGGGNGGTGFGSPSVQTYDYVDPKAGSRTRLVEMVKGGLFITTHWDLLGYLVVIDSGMGFQRQE